MSGSILDATAEKVLDPLGSFSDIMPGLMHSDCISMVASGETLDREGSSRAGALQLRPAPLDEIENIPLNPYEKEYNP